MALPHNAVAWSAVCDCGISYNLKEIICCDAHWKNPMSITTNDFFEILDFLYHFLEIADFYGNFL